MSSIIVPYMILNRKSIGGRGFIYNYREIEDEKNIRPFIDWGIKGSVKQCKAMNEERLHQWMFRLYMAARMILSASHTIQAWDFALSNNLRVAAPHLLYNSLLSASRAAIFACPWCEYSGGEIFTQTHTKSINLTTDILKKYDSDIADKYNERATSLKDLREVLTYKHPTSGDCHFDKARPDKEITLLCEIAQIQSELFEQSYTKHVQQQFQFDLDKAPTSLFTHTNAEGSIIDQEDWYRLDYLKRKLRRPMNIRLLMTEG